MRQVLYGILRNEADASGRVSTLAVGPQLHLIANDDLGAAVSVAVDAAARPPDPKIHAQIVQALHAVCPVLPMRHEIGRAHV